jgi:predicted anti-sigma-YlaC factor YlaD
MHAVVMESLEEYLVGVLEPAALRDLEAHLNTCQMCREEVQSMREVSRMFGTLRVQETESLEVMPGFFSKVMDGVTQQKTASTGLFGMDWFFGRRLVFASLLTLAVLGGYLVSHERDYVDGPSPEAILAQQNSPAFATAPAEENMLITLTAYEH